MKKFGIAGGILASAALCLIVSVLIGNCRSVPAGAVISGTVLDDNGPVNGARVRIKTNDFFTTTDKKGKFTLPLNGQTGEVTITGWAPGHYVGWTTIKPGENTVSITIKKYYTDDFADYTWFSAEGKEGSASCGLCMPSYKEWIADSHSQSAKNLLFLSMYYGTDLAGNKSPPTRFLNHKDYGTLALPPDPDKPYYGPGYKLDFPELAGNCATCHIPAAAAKPGREFAVDPASVSAVEKEGVLCELCHKIGEVLIDPVTGLPDKNLPGVLSYRLYRPAGDNQLFFANFDDVTRRVSYSGLYEESAYCAPCHYGVFWGTTVYNSYGEWLESSYSNPDTGRTCQDCHMPVVDYSYFTFPEKGGLERNPKRIFSHKMPGAADEALLRDTVTLDASAAAYNALLKIEVRLTNANAGHHVPTDSPLRHMILLVEARDDTGNPLALRTGQVLPDFCGKGADTARNFNGLPGKVYAKILQEAWTGYFPTGAYWNPVNTLSDTRLKAHETDTTIYTYDLPKINGPKTITIRIRVIFRRAFLELMKQKGWNNPDILMEEKLLSIAIQ